MTLGIVANLHLVAQTRLALQRLQFVDQRSQQGCLTTPIGAKESHTFTTVQFNPIGT